MIWIGIALLLILLALGWIILELTLIRMHVIAAIPRILRGLFDEDGPRLSYLNQHAYEILTILEGHEKRRKEQERERDQY